MPPFSSTAEDFELCDQVVCASAARHNNLVDLEHETLEESTVTLVWHVGGIIGNGGFEFLFGGDFSPDPEYTATIQAFRRIGCNQAADIFEEALRRSFPDRKVPIGADDRLALYYKLPEKEREDLDTRFIRTDKETIRKLATFIRENWSILSQL